MTRSHPQRPFAPSPPGSLLKRATVPTTTARTSHHGDADDYLRLVRASPCLCCGMEPSEACHVRFASAAYGKASGLQKKPGPEWVLPLCASCHRLNRDAQHNRGEREFWEKLGIDPLPTCVALFAQRGDLVAMRAVVFHTIMNRRKT
jgi:hypothetical protein